MKPYLYRDAEGVFEFPVYRQDGSVTGIVNSYICAEKDGKIYTYVFNPRIMSEQQAVEEFAKQQACAELAQ